MGHPDGDGQKAIRAGDWNLGAQSGLQSWVCRSHAINETGLRGNTEDSYRCRVSHMPTEHVSPATWRANCAPQLSDRTLAQLCACPLTGHLVWTDGRSRGQTVSVALQSPFRSRPEATVTQMLALSPILAPLPCTSCFGHNK